MRNSAILLFSIAILGCESEPTWIDRSKLDWETQVLSEAENERQEELLKEIQGDISTQDLLAGKPASDYSELLSLADRTCTQGTETAYCYDVIGGGDINEPREAIIIVADEKIKYAGWPYCDF